MDLILVAATLAREDQFGMVPQAFRWYTWILSTQQSFKGEKVYKILKWTFIFLAAGQEKASNSGRCVWIHGVSLLPDEDCWS